MSSSFWGEDVTPVKQEEKKDSFWGEDVSILPKTAKAEKLSKFQAGLKGLAQGVSFGFSDEVIAGVKAAFEKATGSDEGFTELFNKEAKKYREELKQARKEHPGAYFAGEAASLLVPGMAVAKGVNLAGKAVRAGGVAATEGFGREDGSLEDRLKSAAISGTVGASTLGVGGGAAKLAKKGAGWLKANPQKALGGYAALAGDPISAAIIYMMGSSKGIRGTRKFEEAKKLAEAFQKKFPGKDPSPKDLKRMKSRLDAEEKVKKKEWDRQDAEMFKQQKADSKADWERLKTREALEKVNKKSKDIADKQIQRELKAADKKTKKRVQKELKEKKEAELVEKRAKKTKKKEDLATVLETVKPDKKPKIKMKGEKQVKPKSAREEVNQRMADGTWQQLPRAERQRLLQTSKIEQLKQK